MRGKVVCTAEVEHALHLAEFIQNVDTIVRRRLSPTGDTILSASLAVDVEILSLYELASSDGRRAVRGCLPGAHGPADG